MIVGYGSMTDYVKSKVISDKRIIFHGKSIGEEKEFIFRISKAFILPSLSEGIPIAVLEALSNKLLCLLTKECNFNKLDKLGSSIEIKKDTDNIKHSLKRLFKLKEKEFIQRTQIGLNYINEIHNWEKIAKETYSKYRSIIV